MLKTVRENLHPQQADIKSESIEAQNISDASRSSYKKGVLVFGVWGSSILCLSLSSVEWLDTAPVSKSELNLHFGRL